ncbi:hypothetical protein [Streptomyces sp. NPDC007929]|uniref:hypothetical protein n=1 Tax=unclassified Streptomyces TaxID=2593676 RepID=UPI0036EC8322
MYSVIAVPPPTTEDERNPTPDRLAPGALRFVGGLRIVDGLELVGGLRFVGGLRPAGPVR